MLFHLEMLKSGLFNVQLPEKLKNFVEKKLMFFIYPYYQTLSKKYANDIYLVLFFSRILYYLFFVVKMLQNFKIQSNVHFSILEGKK